MILLDTNVLSEFVRPSPDPGVVRWARRSARALAVPTVAIGEMVHGVEKLAAGGRRRALERAVERLVTEFGDRVLAFDTRAAWSYGRILATSRRQGRPMSVPDAAIAAIADVNGCALATRNLTDFEPIGLDLIDPWRDAPRAGS